MHWLLTVYYLAAIRRNIKLISNGLVRKDANTKYKNFCFKSCSPRLKQPPTCVYVCTCVYAHFTSSRAQTLSSPCDTDQADFTDWISFQPFNLTEEISQRKFALYTEVLSGNI